MSGVAEAEVRGPDGRPQKVGVGSILVISEDMCAAVAYIQQVYPGERKDVSYAKDEAAAKAVL